MARLTPSRRRALYAKSIEMGASGADGGVDGEHLLTHALAETSDGPLEVRDGYDTLRPRDWTSAELIDNSIVYYGLPEDDVTHEVLVRVTAVENDGEPFTDDDLFEAVEATLHEIYPYGDGRTVHGAPVVPVLVRVD